MSINERLLEITKQLSFLELPIGVYVVTFDGKIVEANRRAREILNLPREGAIEDSITKFYKDLSDRDSLPEKLRAEEAKGHFLISKLTFKVDGKDIHIQDHARTIKDPETQQELGYLCCIMDITSEVRYQKMFDDLPVGLYWLDRSDRIVRANEAFATLFGYDSPEELHGRQIQDFYVDPEEAREFKEVLKDAGNIQDYIVQVINKDKRRIFVRVSATMLTTPSGEYDGREGTVMEAPQERYRRILEVAPIGLFEVQKQENEDRITHYNQQFIEINEFDDGRQADNFDMRRLHASVEDYNQFIKELEENDQLLDREVRIKTLKENEKVVRVSVRSIRDRNQMNVGRIGVVRDVTELRHRVEELTDDIGQVLHTYSAALVEIKQSCDALIDSMPPNPFKKAKNLLPTLAVQELTAPTLQLVHMLDRLLDLTRSRERETDLLMGKRDDLARLTNMFKNYESEIPHPELRPAALREATYELLPICEDIKGEKLPRELLRQIKIQGQELLRILNLLTLLQMQDLTFTMGHPVRALREFVISGRRVEQPRSLHDVSTLITQAINNIKGFAKSRGVQFRKKIECPEALINVVERDIIRALANILHNAVKYSWTRADSTSPWILIRAFEENNSIHIVFENYGVPIPQDEIDEGLIFELGFRGRMSSDRGRTGTGVGLADTLRVAREHGGDLTVRSQPAVFSRKADNYNQPFLTTVTFSLPVNRKEGE
jgi:PAS domain S-box-containing protein